MIDELQSQTLPIKLHFILLFLTKNKVLFYLFV